MIFTIQIFTLFAHFVSIGGLVETLHCSFDLDLCGMQQDKTDNMDWKLQNGKTQTFQTGPECDPVDCRQGKYIFIESSFPRRTGDTAVVRTPIVGGEGMRCLSFFYHMYGDHIGALRVTLTSALTDSVYMMWYLAGDQGNQWHTKHIEFESLSAYYISFVASVGNGYKGDIAIDSISLTQDRCQASLRFDCSFEHDMCGWINSPQDAHHLEWTRHSGNTDTPYTGPSSDRVSENGVYLYVESSRTFPGETARLVSPTLSGSPSGHCLTFYYHMYGSTSGDLTLNKVSETGLETTLFSIQGDKGDNWIFSRVNVSSSAGESFNIVFDAVMAGWRGDVAIDDVSIQNQMCGS